jgi:DNA primase catalytic subunit
MAIVSTVVHTKSAPRSRSALAQYFLNRELSYTLSLKGDEVYVRYKSYDSAAKFAEAIRSELPIKLDIGAIYPCPVRRARVVR